MFMFPFNKEANLINHSKTVNIDIQYSIIIKFIKSLYDVNFYFLPAFVTHKMNLANHLCVSNPMKKATQKNSKKYAKQIPACKSYTLFTPGSELNSRWVRITLTFQVIWWSPTMDALQMRVKQNKKKTLFKTRHRYKRGSHSHEMLQFSACPEIVWVEQSCARIEIRKILALNTEHDLSS